MYSLFVLVLVLELLVVLVVGSPFTYVLWFVLKTPLVPEAPVFVLLLVKFLVEYLDVIGFAFTDGLLVIFLSIGTEEFWIGAALKLPKRSELRLLFSVLKEFCGGILEKSIE